MDKKLFQNPSKFFSIVMFIQEDTFKRMRSELESLGNQKNVKLVIQPGPYEAIEFLYQVDLDFANGHISQEKEFFWHVLEFKRNLLPDAVNDISDHHHNFLVSILESDTKKVEKERKALELLIRKNS